MSLMKAHVRRIRDNTRENFLSPREACTIIVLNFSLLSQKFCYNSVGCNSGYSVLSFKQARRASQAGFKIISLN